MSFLKFLIFSQNFFLKILQSIMIVKLLFSFTDMFVVCYSLEENECLEFDLNDYDSINKLLEDDAEILKNQKNIQMFDNRLENEHSENNCEVISKKRKTDESSSNISASLENIITDVTNSHTFDFSSALLNFDFIESNDKNFKPYQTINQTDISKDSESSSLSENSNEENVNQMFQQIDTIIETDSDCTGKILNEENGSLSLKKSDLYSKQMEFCKKISSIKDLFADFFRRFGKVCSKTLHSKLVLQTSKNAEKKFNAFNSIFMKKNELFLDIKLSVNLLNLTENFLNLLLTAFSEKEIPKNFSILISEINNIFEKILNESKSVESSIFIAKLGSDNISYNTGHKFVFDRTVSLKTLFPNKNKFTNKNFLIHHDNAYFVISAKRRGFGIIVLNLKSNSDEIQYFDNFTVKNVKESEIFKLNCKRIAISSNNQLYLLQFNLIKDFEILVLDHHFVYSHSISCNNVEKFLFKPGKVHIVDFRIFGDNLYLLDTKNNRIIITDLMFRQKDEILLNIQFSESVERIFLIVSEKYIIIVDIKAFYIRRRNEPAESFKTFNFVQPIVASSVDLITEDKILIKQHLTKYFYYFEIDSTYKDLSIKQSKQFIFPKNKKRNCHIAVSSYGKVYSSIINENIEIYRLQFPNENLVNTSNLCTAASSNDQVQNAVNDN